MKMNVAAGTPNQGNMDIIRNKFQLSTVRCVDPDANSVVDLSGHTALYNYDKDKETWSKTDIEGTLMIYTRNCRPRNMITIINKNSKSNFIEPITKNCDVQLKTPYVLFRDDSMKILGIWFSDGEDVPRIYKAICMYIQQVEEEATQCNKNLIRGLLNERPAPQEVLPSAVPGEDIMSMLSKARVEFDTRNEPLNEHSRNEGTTNNVLSDFFAKVSCKTNLPVHTTSAETNANPVLQQLFQGAAAVGGQASVNNNNIAKSSPVPVPGSTVHLGENSGGKTDTKLKQSAPMSLEELEGKMRKTLHSGEGTGTSSKKTTLLSPHVFSIKNTNPSNQDINSTGFDQSSSGSLLSSSSLSAMLGNNNQTNNFPVRVSADSGLSDSGLLNHEQNEIQKLLGLGGTSDSILSNSSTVPNLISNSSLFSTHQINNNNFSTIPAFQTSASDLLPLNMTQFTMAFKRALQKEQFLKLLHESYLEVIDQKGINN